MPLEVLGRSCAFPTPHMSEKSTPRHIAQNTAEFVTGTAYLTLVGMLLYGAKRSANAEDMQDLSLLRPQFYT